MTEVDEQRMEAMIRTIENSELWDKRYGIPTIPQHNNPHIYRAIIFRCLTAQKIPIPDAWRINTTTFIAACYQHSEEHKTSFLTVWPDLSGGEYSHDEAIGDGAAGDGKEAAIILSDLAKYDGLYPNKKGELDPSRYFYRFVFLKPYLHSRGMKNSPSLISQFAWIMHVLNSSRTSKRDSFDPDGLLKIWVMEEDMVRHPLCATAVWYWKRRLKKEGIGPRKIFTSHYLNECFTMRVIAPEDF